MPVSATDRLVVGSEVAAALAAGTPVVAMESTIYSNLGLPAPANVEALTRMADRHYVIEKGRVVWTGDSPGLRAAADIQLRYLGVSREVRPS